MDLDAKVCYCFHVTRRKLVNFVRKEKPKVPSQLSQCGGAGTGCGWCIPFLKQIHAQADADLEILTPEDTQAACGVHPRARGRRRLARHRSLRQSLKRKRRSRVSFAYASGSDPYRTTRNGMLRTLIVLLLFGGVAHAQHRLATFGADVTPPLGHPCMGGGIAPAREDRRPAVRHGFVLLGDGEAGRRRRGRLVRDPQRRLRPLARGPGRGRRHRRPRASWSPALHQHDAPIADLEAQRLLDERQGGGQHLRPRVPRAGRAARRPGRPRRAEVGRGRSPTSAPARRRSRRSRRTAATSARTASPRSTACSATARPRDPRPAARGLIDPWLKTLSFWDGDTAGARP